MESFIYQVAILVAPGNGLGWLNLDCLVFVSSPRLVNGATDWLLSARCVRICTYLALQRNVYYGLEFVDDLRYFSK